MKKSNFIITLVAATAVMLITSCTGEKGAGEKADTLTPVVGDTVSGAVPIKLFNSKLFSKNSITDIPVCAELASQCTTEYQTKYKGANFDAAFIQRAFTTSVRFGSKELGAWMKDIENNTDATHIKIYFGAYTKRMIQAFSTQIDSNKEGRLTVFLWPYNGTVKAKYTKHSTYDTGNGCTKALTKGEPGEEADPFNIAGLEP